MIKKFSKVNYKHHFLYYGENFANVILIVKISVLVKKYFERSHEDVFSRAKCLIQFRRDFFSVSAGFYFDDNELQ